MIRQSRNSVCVLLLAALYTFMGLPLAPLWAQEGLEVTPPEEQKVDQTPPVISHTPSSEPIPRNEPIELSAVVTDDTGVSKVILYYRFRGLGSIELFIGLPFLIAGLGGGPLGVKSPYKGLDFILETEDTWTLQIPEKEVKREYLQYYLEASDLTGNIARFGNPKEPIEVTLRKAWYQHWGIWVAVVIPVVIVGGIIYFRNTMEIKNIPAPGGN